MIIFRYWIAVCLLMVFFNPVPVYGQISQEPTLTLEQPNLPDRRSVRVYEYVPQNNPNIVIIVAQAPRTGKLATLTTKKFGSCGRDNNRRTTPTAVLDNPSADESLDVYIYEYDSPCASGLVVITTAAFDNQLKIDLIPRSRN